MSNITVEKSEKDLKPCPLCGARARINSWTISRDAERTEIMCTGCGLTLDWTQRFALSRAARVNVDPDFFTAWNRRAKI